MDMGDSAGMTGIGAWRDDEMWPSASHRAGAFVALWFTSSALAGMITKRAPRSLSTLRATSPARLLVCLNLVISDAFVFSASLLLFGIGTSFNEYACDAGITMCLTLYALAKISIYGFLMERVHLVHAFTPTSRKGRLQSNWYRAGAALLLGWVCLYALALVYRVSDLRKSDGACVLGVRRGAAIAGVCIDFVISIYLTVAFAWPIWRSSFPQARALARSSVVLSTAALVSTTANISVLIAMRGHQRGFVCFLMCAMDLLANALILYIVTNGTSDATAGSSAPTRPPPQLPPTLSVSVHRSPDPRSGLGLISSTLSPAMAQKGSLAEDLYFLGRDDREEGGRTPSMRPRMETGRLASRRRMDEDSEDEDEKVYGAGSISTLAKTFPVMAKKH